MSGDIDLLRPLPARNGVNVLAYTPLYPPRGPLFGFCDLCIPGFRLRLSGCTAHVQGDRRWVGLPARPWVNRDNELFRDAATGKIRYQPVVAFDSNDILNRFSEAAVAAVEGYDAGAFR